MSLYPHLSFPIFFLLTGLEGASIKGIRRAGKTTLLQTSREPYTLTGRSPVSRNDSSLIFSTMSLRLKATSSCPGTSPLRVLHGLLLLSLLLTLVPWTAGKIPSVDRKRFVELRCMCLNTVSGIHPSNIQSLEVLRAGPHCANVEVIATLKNGKKICLDPEAPKIKKIVQKMLESSGSTA
ncbi:unnamed protein product [Gulo gulo]|uniref:C-X-C motif chemokine n=1 Tax=Gulo gulo TaxID=48420 RepID=A0A9X9LL73_GULGU|nr:unnamed protein product [Gulo gulo]